MKHASANPIKYIKPLLSAYVEVPSILDEVFVETIGGELFDADSEVVDYERSPLDVLRLVLFALGLAAGDTALSTILAMTAEDAPGWVLAALPLALALMLVIAADGTGGATAEISGRHEALAAAGDALRLTVWLALVAVLFLPPHPPMGQVDPAATAGNWLIHLPAWLAKMALLAFGVAGARTLALWPRAHSVPAMLALAGLLAVLGIMLLFAGQRQP